MLINTIDSLLNSEKTDDVTREIAQFVKDHMKEIPAMSIDHMAQGCFVSKAMITKFVRKLGYENFKEFKYQVQEQINAFARKYPFYEFRDEALSQNAIDMMDEVTVGLRNLIAEIDYDQLEELIADLQKARIIMMAGQGDTESICRRFQSSLDYLHKDVRICDQNLKRLEQLGRQDVIVCVSVNGYSFVYGERFMRMINQVQVRKWLITCADVRSFAGKVIRLPAIDHSLNDLLVSFVLRIAANAVNQEEEKRSEFKEEFSVGRGDSRQSD